MTDDCRHPVLYDNPKQPGVNIYLCARCDAEFKVNEFELRRAGLETRTAPACDCDWDRCEMTQHFPGCASLNR